MLCIATNLCTYIEMHVDSKVHECKDICTEILTSCYVAYQENSFSRNVSEAQSVHLILSLVKHPGT